MYITHPVLYVSRHITYGTNYSATFYELNAVHRSFFIKLFFKLPERAGDALYIRHPVLYVLRRIRYGTNYSATFYTN
jgi:hypothetical protein